MGELEDFFANIPDNPEDGPSMTPKHVEILCDVISDLVHKAMEPNNQISITLTRVIPEGPAVWATTIHGTPIVIDSFQELLGALNRLA